MKPKKYDFTKLYQKWYKFLIPNLCFYIPAIGGTLSTLIFLISDGIDSETLMIAIIILASSWIVAFLSRFFSAVAISQKVVATDALLTLSNKEGTSANIDDLPEL